MKRIVNEKDALCTACFFCPGVKFEHGRAVCKRCGCDYLVDLQGNAFKPLFAKERRVNNLPRRSQIERRWVV